MSLRRTIGGLLTLLLEGLPSLGGVAWALPRRPHQQACPPFNNGSFVIDQYALYPENADWDTKNCILYFGSLFNSSVAIYDPYKAQTVDILEFPNITFNPTLHLGGVGVDPYTGLVTIVVDAGAPFLTNGQDISGDNFILKWDPKSRKVLWQHNITAVTGGLYGGFQDVETDSRGNTYVVGTFPGTIMRVDPAGKAVTPWYLPGTPPFNSTTATRYGGLASVPKSDILLVNDAQAGEIYRLDMKADKGNPMLVPRTPAGSRKMNSDSIYLPPKYGGKVLLVSEDAMGVNVLRSRDGKWQTAEHLGEVYNNVSEAQGGSVPAATQIGDSLFMIEEFFTDPFVPPHNVAGNRSLFPMVDITSKVTALVGY